MTSDNELRVAAMTEEEREHERRDILEKLGPGIEDILKKIREGRERNNLTALRQELPTQKQESNISDSLEEVPLDSSPRSKSPAPRVPLTPALSYAGSPANTRPASRASRKLRFAELTPNDVHVYESAPPSPRKKALALLAPSAGERDVVSLGQWGGTINSLQEKMDVDPPPAQPTVGSKSEPEPEEGTPEYIRRRFFPSAPAHNPDLAWMEELKPLPSAAPSSDALRFDLSGKPLAAPLHSSLPTHLGLHHHAPDADGVQRAGYTLDDVFMMSRSGVKAQRSAAMRILVGVARWIGAVHRGDEDPAEGMMKVSEIVDLKQRIVAAGIEAMGERGSLGAHAIEVVYECVVGWAQADEALDVDATPDIVGVELGNTDASFPLSYLLPQVVAAFSTQSLHSSSDIHPSLIPSFFRTFLLTGASCSSVDSCLALDLITTLATSTRANAQALTQPADALLRFVTTSSPYPALLTRTLNFYRVLAAYGLYSHIASTAHLQFAAIAQHVLEHSQDRSLMQAWVGVLEAWIVCATDPHQTTPDHDILWSQVVAWGWGQDVLALRGQLGTLPRDWDVWAALWSAEAAWLEGARVNGVKSGEKERGECVLAVKAGFEQDGGKECEVLRDLGRCGGTLMAAIRLWLACLPPTTDGPLASPPFDLPFTQLSDLCAKLVTHPLWSRLPPGYVLLRPLTGLLSSYLRLSKRLPDNSQDVWMAQALSILSRLLPGDEEFALQVAGDILDLITPQWAVSHGLNVPQSVWDKGGLSVIKPFLSRAIRPREDVHIGPWCMSSHSIKLATTLRVPSVSSALSRDYGLPVPRDWTFSPLDHLLRSGTSSVFNNLPTSWDASEVDVTRAALLLTKICREVTLRFSFVDFVLTREEAVFGCMKVFMLEHGQVHNDSAEEVFRDRMVGQLMDDLLAPFTVASASSSGPALSPVIPSPPSQRDLEQVSVRFLGDSTPFYQYYTDFIALYDAISFSHSTFARLLLPPTSMRYAPDYRKHLWNDFGHVLKTIRTSPDSVIAADLGEYMWPVDTDSQMIGAYLRSLVKGPLHGFLRLVATHHIAYSIWPDLRESSVGGEVRAEKLIRAIIEQGDVEVVAEVLRYRQEREGLVSAPPKCFELDEEVKNRRLEYIESVGVQGLLQ
ncbi:hypothetical protein B0H10DRAFT_2051136 [Mycena sp. CBHHK59/15]|nr:hypothetical protein B0H10DRAFT_2051136 [Mycena sp. CBHHK59/15]